MIDSSTLLENLNIVIVFIEGLLSFFSPCVLPMLPIYMGYLAGNAGDEDGKKKQRNVFFFTLCFIAGIFTAILLLNFSFSFLRLFFQDNQVLFGRIGGVLIICLGIYQLGLIKFKFLEKTMHIQVKLQKKRMSVWLAFFMGFTFSFAWTPCIGPALSSILILAGNANSVWVSYGLVVVYALGFVIPFLILGMFTTKALTFIKNHQSFMKYTVKIGAILLIAVGLLMVSGNIGIIGGSSIPPVSEEQGTTDKEENTEDTDKNTGEQAKQAAPKIELENQDGSIYKLTDAKGKVVFINFWGTWCPQCKLELPEIQKLYETHKDSKEVEVISVVLPDQGKEVSKEGVIAFMEENGYDFPVLFDTTGSVFSQYGIRAFPTTFMIDKKGSIYGYLEGRIEFNMMQEIINKTISGKDPQAE